ncbi:DUF3060 domain-containing protein [Frigoribacterium sp. VKM Ac-2836]|uniref:DUF3060 domain-containing protein n=1 Tax=Frigoribacterium sp. VKM Ac-2836 TaxID=2739014 RepID=UPI001567877A|nr:DUF3060 domain-containing protein [Frigoribacterium sp. VKM Ac-2836]NRD27877.1 DUF3060 domain-containing protein [Frigoribacterium sp. VKM Ac-2836]
MVSVLLRRGTTPAALSAVAAIFLMSACSSTETDRTPSPTASDTVDAATVGTCDDGFMLIDLGSTDDAAPPLDTSSCDLVSIVGTSGTVVLDEVGTLVIEGTDVTVSVRDVESVQLAGDHDTVTHAGPAPTVDDQGQDNTVTAAAEPAAE